MFKLGYVVPLFCFTFLKLLWLFSLHFPIFYDFSPSFFNFEITLLCSSNDYMHLFFHSFLTPLNKWTTGGLCMWLLFDWQTFGGTSLPKCLGKQYSLFLSYVCAVLYHFIWREIFFFFLSFYLSLHSFFFSNPYSKLQAVVYSLLMSEEKKRKGSIQDLSVRPLAGRTMFTSFR